MDPENMEFLDWFAQQNHQTGVDPWKNLRPGVDDESSRGRRKKEGKTYLQWQQGNVGGGDDDAHDDDDDDDAGDDDDDEADEADAADDRDDDEEEDDKDEEMMMMMIMMMMLMMMMMTMMMMMMTMMTMMMMTMMTMMLMMVMVVGLGGLGGPFAWKTTWCPWAAPGILAKARRLQLADASFRDQGWSSKHGDLSAKKCVDMWYRQVFKNLGV